MASSGKSIDWRLKAGAQAMLALRPQAADETAVSAEQLSAFVEGRLSGTERQAMIARVAADPVVAEAVGELARAIEGHVAARRRVGPPQWTRWLLAAGLAALALSLAVRLIRVDPDPDLSVPRSPTATVSAPQYLVLPRPPNDRRGDLAAFNGGAWEALRAALPAAAPDALTTWTGQWGQACGQYCDGLSADEVELSGQVAFRLGEWAGRALLNCALGKALPPAWQEPLLARRWGAGLPESTAVRQLLDSVGRDSVPACDSASATVTRSACLERGSCHSADNNLGD